MTDWAGRFRKAARRALPPVDGELTVPGLREPVDVARDTWGVPHISAANLDDLFLAQGFVTASERLFQIDLTLRAANGRLASMFSELTLPLDRFVRTVGWNRAGRRVAASYDALSTRMVEAFAVGVEAWVERMPARPVEYEVLELDPWLPAGDGRLGAWAACSVLMAYGLSGNWDTELLRAEIAAKLGWEAMRTLFPDLPAVDPAAIPGMSDPRRLGLELLRQAPSRPGGQGSNNWVVAGSRTTTGKPLLANDPHLSVSMPSIWFECHLACPEYEAAGVALPFSPGVVIGHTAHHAWGFTNVGGDTQDLYLERLNDDGTAALHEGAWEPVRVHIEEIEVRGHEATVLEVRETRHGPILDSYLVGIGDPTVVEGGVAETYALRWVGSERAIPLSALVLMGQARSFPEFREAVRHWDCPGQNMVYADVDGTIGYQCTGLYPVRRGGDGTLPVPGWTAEHEWDGWLPFDALPWAENPQQGFLATANQRIHDGSYPHLIGVDFLPPHRAQRIVELLAATPKHSRETFARMQADTVSIPARQIAPLLREVEPGNDRQKGAIAQLDGWDGDLAADSVAAAIYQVWCKHIAELVLLPRLGDELFTHYHGRREWTNQFQFLVLPNLLAAPTATWFGGDGREGRDELLRRALDAALDELTGRLGEDPSAWRWGALHRVEFAHPLAPIPDLAGLFAGGVAERGGDESTLNQSAFEPEDPEYLAQIIPSWRQIIDLADPDESVGIHTTGQAGNPASSHWDDLVTPWARGEHHALPFTREAVDRVIESRLRLLPR